MEKFKFGFLSIFCAISFLAGLNFCSFMAQNSDVSNLKNYSDYTLKQVQNTFDLKQTYQISYNGYNPYRKKKC